MPAPQSEPWTWRHRVRDPRFPAFVLLLAASATLAASVLGFNLGAAVFAVTSGIGIGLLALPRWRDTKHGPTAGAVVLSAGALLVLVLTWLVG